MTFFLSKTTKEKIKTYLCIIKLIKVTLMAYKLVDSSNSFSIISHKLPSKSLTPLMKLPKLSNNSNIITSKNIKSSHLLSADLESKFFLNHKYNNSWNIEQPIKLVRKQTEMEESQNRNKLISLNNSELKNLIKRNKNEKIKLISIGTLNSLTTPNKEKRKELYEFLKKCNKDVIDIMISRKSNLEAYQSMYKEKNKVKFENLEIRTKFKEINKIPKLHHSKLSHFEEDLWLSSTPKIRLNQIKIEKKTDIPEKSKEKNNLYFARFLRKSKIEKSFQDSFIKHITKLSFHREKLTEMSKNHQKPQESMVTDFKKQNQMQMEIENQKKLESLKSLGTLIDYEITQQDETVDKLLDSFKHMMNSEFI